MTNASGILLGSKLFSATIKASISMECEVPQFPVEKGFPISDNIKRKAPKFDMEITLGGSNQKQIPDLRVREYEDLKKILDDGIPLTLMCEWGRFENVVITSLSPVLELSMNTYACSVTLIQIEIAKLETKQFVVSDVDGKVLYQDASPKEGALMAAIEAREAVPVEKTSNWYDPIVAFISLSWL